MRRGRELEERIQKNQTPEPGSGVVGPCTAQPTLQERLSPLSGFWGWLLVKLVSPDEVTKVKTTAKAEPSTSEIDDRIVERFADHQAQMIERLRQLPTSLDPQKTIITSPLLGFVTYSLENTFTNFVAHSRRHLDQAGRVTGSEGFPR